MTDPRPRSSHPTILLADVGNSRIKLAALARPGSGPTPGSLPLLASRHDLPSRDFDSSELGRWLAGIAPGEALLLMGSVQDAAAARLEGAIAGAAGLRAAPVRLRRIAHGDLPLEVRVPEPGRVGIDRLAAAAAVATIKPAGRPAVVVDCGTAATVGCIAADGAFLGGAIFAGPGLLARALATGTSKLPDVGEPSIPPPPLPARSTREAIAAGIGWGIQGAVRTLVDRARESLGGAAPVYLTGGDRGAVRDALPGAVELPDLVLQGLALAAARIGPGAASGSAGAAGDAAGRPR